MAVTAAGARPGASDPLANGGLSEAAYHALFGVLTVVLVTAVASSSRSQDVRPSDEMRARQQAQGGRAAARGLSLPYDKKRERPVPVASPDPYRCTNARVGAV